MNCKLLFLLVWAIASWDSGEGSLGARFRQRKSASGVPHIVHVLKFKSKLKEFQGCLAARYRHKPHDAFDCMTFLKLASDPYWGNPANAGFADLTLEESKIAGAIKQLHHLEQLLRSEGWNRNSNWNDVKEILESKKEGGSGEGSGRYDHYPHPHYYDDEDLHEIDDYSGDGGSGGGSGGIISAGEGGLKGLIEVLEKLGTLIPTTEPNQRTCEEPFVNVAYKVCILPVFNRKLSWDGAQEYCRSRNLFLALDSVVIKSRRYLNDHLGETGTRVRWTVWVGGKQEEDGAKRWLWSDGVPVSSFLWSKGQPRTYGSHSTPAGTCMALDGFREYYATSIPCHLRRYFVCQKPS